MRQSQQTCAVTLLSIHDALKAEKLLQGCSLAVRLIPVPKQISPECGLALQISCRELEQVRQALGEIAHRIKQVFIIEGAAFRPLE